MKRLAICLMAALAACPTGKRFMKGNDVAQAIGARLAELRLVVTSPTCPNVEVKKGVLFECSLVVETMTYPIAGRVADLVDGFPRFEIVWKNGTHGAVLRQLAIPPVREELWKEFEATADVDCRDALIYLDDKHSTTCTFRPHGIEAKVTIAFDDKGTHTGWTTTPTLLNRKRMQADVMTDIKAKVGPTAEIKCGDKPVNVEPVIVRPDDGKVLCALTANEKGKPTTGEVVINVGPDRKVTGWEMR